MVKVELLNNSIKLDNKGILQPRTIKIDTNLLESVLELLVMKYCKINISNSGINIKDFSIKEEFYFDRNSRSLEVYCKVRYNINIHDMNIEIEENSYIYDLITYIYYYMTSRICLYRVYDLDRYFIKLRNLLSNNV